MLGNMDGIPAVSGPQGADASMDLIMLKKTQDLMKQQSSQLLATLPPPPSPAGVGGRIDVRA